MNLFLQDANALFVHIPKTGGTWVGEALDRLDIPHRGARKQQRLSGHCPPWFCRESHRFAFAFVRHPLAWYESRWRYQRGRWTVFEPEGWHPQRCLEPAADDDFEQFMRKCLTLQPAYVTRLYEWYIGPPGLELDFVGRTESLADDLAVVLTELGYALDVDSLSTIPPENTSPRREITWNPKQQQQTIQSEYGAIQRYYPLGPASPI